MTYKELRENGIPSPVYKILPQTDAANVIENIELWLGLNPEYEGSPDKVAKFLRQDKSKKHGYRFVSSDDLDEEITELRTISGIEYSVSFKRRIHAPDHFCPLWFSVWYDVITFSHNEISFVFTSISNLIKKTSDIKKTVKHNRE